MKAKLRTWGHDRTVHETPLDISIKIGEVNDITGDRELIVVIKTGLGFPTTMEFCFQENELKKLVEEAAELDDLLG